MFALTFGDIGSCKSLDQAQTSFGLLLQSLKFQKKYNLPKREVWCNFHLNKEIQKRFYDRLFYWRDPQQMVFTDYPQNTKIRRNFDCVWDEIAVEIPSDKWKETDPEIRRFFAQHRKRGIRIFANTQDYMMVDINARRMATDIFQVHKIFGSRDPSPTLPPLKFIWGFGVKWRLDKALLRIDDQNRRHTDLIPRFIPITRKAVNLYDTSEDIYKEPNQYLMHRERLCATCGFKKYEHF